MFVDSRIIAVKKSVTEIQCTERKLHKSLEKVEAQIKFFQKTVESFLPTFDTMSSELPNASPKDTNAIFSAMTSIINEEKVKSR